MVVRLSACPAWKRTSAALALAAHGVRICPGAIAATCERQKVKKEWQKTQFEAQVQCKYKCNSHLY